MSVINAQHQIAPLIPGVAAERRPEPVGPRQGPREQAEPQQGAGQILPQERETAEKLMKRYALEVDADKVDGRPQNLRAQRALDAYASLQNSSDRDYVARVLGVDEQA